MTVSTVVDHNDYTGNGVTTSFPYTFRIFKKTDLTVSVIDLSENITVLVLDTDYTVTNAGGYNGGSVVLTTPLANGWQISIARELEPTQETDLRNQGKFFAEVHEDAFDKLTMLIQQAYSVFRLALRKPSSVANWYDALNNYIRNVKDPRDPQDAATKSYVDTLASGNLGRTLRVPEQIPQLPDAATRANKMPAFDSSGNPIVVVPPSGSASDVMIELAKPTGSSNIGYQYRNNSTSTKRKVSDVLNERVSLWDFHCDASGNVIQPGPAVDSRPYLQAAIDFVYSIGGGTITIPAGATWYLGSYGTGGIAGHSGIIQLRSNVNLDIEGKIQLSSFFDLKSFQVFVGFDNADPAASGNLNNCNIFGGGIIDFGGFNFANTSQLRNGVTLGKSYNCSVKNITFQNGDMTWAITIGWNGYGRNCRVNNCVFNNLCISTNNADHTSIYVGCPFSGVSECHFFNTSERAKQNACTVELHQNNQWYRNSTITGYTRGVYVVMHGAESSGAGRYSYNNIISGNSGDVTGQFCTVGAANEDGGGHLSRVLIASNNISSPDVPAFTYPSSVFIYVGFSFTGIIDGDVSAIIVEGNNFYSPATRSDSYACYFGANSNGIKFSGNNFDCRYMIWCDAVNISNLIWECTNSIGRTHSGLRSGANLFEMRMVKLIDSTLDVRLSAEDTSMFSVVLISSTAQVTFSSLKVHADFTKNMTRTVEITGGQQGASNNYFEYPVRLEFSCYSNANATLCYSTSTDYGWASSAKSLTNAVTGLSTPGAYSVNSNGQLVGVGYNDTATVKTWTGRVLVSSK